MPQIICYGIKIEDVKEASKNIVEEISEISEIPKDWFSIEIREDKCILEGEEGEGTPQIEVKWFNRGISIQNQMAERIYMGFYGKGYEELEIYFTEILEKNYYVKGVNVEEKRKSEERLKKINELAKKDRELTEEEKREQKELREEYLKNFRRNLRGTLEKVVIMDEEGNKKALRKKQ